ncbi:butyrate:acetyl-CoA coenzyme A-transferase [subsurface metagenome]
MDWKQKYKEKLLNVENAVKRVKSGDYIFIGAFGGRPKLIEEELINQRERLKPLNIAQSLIFGHIKFIESGMENYFRYISLFS